MLDVLGGTASSRKLRLFAAACCQRVQELAGERRDLEEAGYYITALEREADGLARPSEWGEAVARVLSKQWDISDRTLDFLPADFCAFLCAIDNDPPEAALWASVNANIALSDFKQRPEADEVGGSPEARVQAPLLRCIFGNPFRPVAVESGWLTSTVAELARGIYADRAFDRLAILADALQDAGCEHPDILGHCRGGGPHVRGCWVVDLVLGKA
jgi:hypothetical protein